MKRIGTREEVFRGVAERTSGGMRKQDIIIKNNKFISRKKSDRMRIMVAQNERFQTFRSNKKTKCNNNLLNKNKNINQTNKKPIKRTQKKVVFHFNKNKVQEYNCPDLNYYCGDKEDEDEDEEDEEEYENNRQISFNKKPKEFKIEKIDDLNIDDLF